jgi:hypothetical protein
MYGGSWASLKPSFEYGGHAGPVGKDIVSAQFNFSPEELAFISQDFIHLDHGQT